MVATLLADRLGINRILIPPFQGVFSALGMLVADFQKEFSRSFLKSFRPGIDREMDKDFAGLVGEARRMLEEDGFSGDSSVIECEVDMRYQGQSYELTVSYGNNFIQDFHQKHLKLYSYKLEDTDCEIVNLRVLALGRTPNIKIRKQKQQSGEAPVLHRKKVYYNGKFQTFTVYRRRDIQPGQSVQVPAIVVSDTSTVVVEQKYDVRADGYGNLVLTRQR
jgi:N-methylhydantoinase A